MELWFDDRTETNIDPPLLKIIEEIVILTLVSEGLIDEPSSGTLTENPFEISISLTDNHEIKSINRRFRNKNQETDVLSFPLQEPWQLEHLKVRRDSTEKFMGYPINKTNKTIPLGDIIISLEKAQTQAAEYGHSLEREIGFLTVHGLLHLLGYDHTEENEETLMITKQENILQCVGLLRLDG